MKRLIIAIGGVLALTLGGLSLSAASASAVAPAPDAITGLKIDWINYNAAGNDVTTNRNQEFVDIVNTSDTAEKEVGGLIFEDSYRHGNPTKSKTSCNKLVVTSFPDAEGKPLTKLPAGHTLRIYVGSAPANPTAFGARDGDEKTIHPVFVNSRPTCGYKGHFLNNNPPASGQGPWDTVWITLGTEVASKSYRFYGGHGTR